MPLFGTNDAKIEAARTDGIPGARARAAMNRFGGNGLYILDEPEAALSPSRQLAMLSRMHALVQQRSQFIIAAHSPILMAYPDAWIYELSDGELRRVRYVDTEHYIVTKRFLNDPQRQLDILLS